MPGDDNKKEEKRSWTTPALLPIDGASFASLNSTPIPPTDPSWPAGRASIQRDVTRHSSKLSLKQFLVLPFFFLFLPMEKIWWIVLIFCRFFPQWLIAVRWRWRKNAVISIRDRKGIGIYFLAFNFFPPFLLKCYSRSKEPKWFYYFTTVFLAQHMVTATFDSSLSKDNRILKVPWKGKKKAKMHIKMLKKEREKKYLTDLNG